MNGWMDKRDVLVIILAIAASMPGTPFHVSFPSFGNPTDHTMLYDYILITDSREVKHGRPFVFPHLRLIQTHI